MAVEKCEEFLYVKRLLRSAKLKLDQGIYLQPGFTEEFESSVQNVGMTIHLLLPLVQIYKCNEIFHGLF